MSALVLDSIAKGLRLFFCVQGKGFIKLCYAVVQSVCPAQLLESDLCCFCLKHTGKGKLDLLSNKKKYCKAAEFIMDVCVAESPYVLRDLSLEINWY